MRVVVVVVLAAREGDPRAGREKNLRLGPALGVDEVLRVDHRRGQGLVVHHRADARAPGGAGVGRVVLGGGVAQVLEGVPALRERQPQANQALQLDAFHLGAVLLGLAPALLLLVVVELAADAVRLAVEDVRERPEEVGQVVLEARAGQEVRDGVHRAEDGGVGVLGLGQGARVAVVLEGPVGVQHQFVERVGRGAGTEGVVGFKGGGRGGFVEHGGLPVGEGRDRRGLRGDRTARGGAGPHPAGRGPGGSRRGVDQGPEQSGGRRPPALLLRDAKATGGAPAGWPRGVDGPAEKSWRAPLRACPVPGSSRPFEEGRGAALSRDGREPCSAEAPSPALVTGALAALRRPA